MTWVNLSLLLGGALVAVPIVLHLVLRQQPKQLVFPALRFLRERRESNRRRLQLRHWLLLALRSAAIALLALALARPSVSSAAIGDWALLGTLALLALIVGGCIVVAALQRRGRLLIGVLIAAELLLLAPMAVLANSALGKTSGIRLGDREAPVSAALVFDTSPRMLYQYNNASRLEVAQELGLWLLQQLPSESQVAVLDAHPGPAVFSVDMAAARKAVERLQTSGVAQPLPDVLDSAAQLLATGRHERKEVYVLTDLTWASWPRDSSVSLRGLVERSDVTLYVIDVGVIQPRNLALGDLRLSAQSLVRNNDLVVETEIRATGAGGTVMVELYVEEPDAERPLIVEGRPLLPVSRLRDRREVPVADDASQAVEFRVSGLAPGVHQGSVVVAAGDGLAVDDVRYFAVDVVEPWPVLVAAPPGVITSFFTEAIAPQQFREAQRARFDCTVIEQSELANRALDGFDVVVLLDPDAIVTAVWEQLGKFVAAGRGMALFLGHRADPNAFQAEAARRLVGGALARQWRAGGDDLFLAPQSYEHPVLAAFRSVATSVPWDRAPVFRHWLLTGVEANSRVVIPYSNGRPALLEQSVGRGIVLTMTTPVSDPARPAGREAWNELPTTEDAWPYFLLVNEITHYLAGAGEGQLNYVTGETAVLVNKPDQDPSRYQLFTPLEEPQEVRAGDNSVVISFTERPGAYRMRGDRGGPVSRGFAVNLAARSTDLQRLPREQLDELFGKDRYKLARSRKDIQREVGESRVGREFYPYLLAMLALVLALEHLLANRFYQRQSAEAQETRESPSAAAAPAGETVPAPPPVPGRAARARIGAS